MVNIRKKLQEHSRQDADAVGTELSGTADSVKFSGYAAVYNVLDKHRDIIVNTSCEINNTANCIPFLWQHDYLSPIGKLIDIKEDDFGLYVEAIITNQTQKGREAIALISQQIVTKLSIGYRVLDEEFIADSGLNYIKRFELIEVSLVTFPANNMTGIELMP